MVDASGTGMFPRTLEEAKKKIATETIVPRAGGAENGALNTVFLTRNGGRASPGLHKLFGS